MIPTSARRRFEKKTTSQSSAEAPSYTMGAVRLSTGLLPINGNNLEGETDKQTNNTCASNKGKQTNKQTNKQTSRGADAGGSVELPNMQSLICNASEYMEELQRCIRKAWSSIHRVIL